MRINKGMRWWTPPTSPTTHSTTHEILKVVDILNLYHTVLMRNAFPTIWIGTSIGP